MKPSVVCGAFDDLRFKDFRFLDEASHRGPLQVKLLSDDAIVRLSGKSPKFPQSEREYLMQAIRFVQSVEIVDAPSATTIEMGSVSDDLLLRAPDAPPISGQAVSPRKKVIVTGCYDWFHSGHVRFFEECSELGDLFVIVGHDANIKLLKGEGHPLFPATQRRYIAGAIRYVHGAFISSGDGWMDAEPEIYQLKPDIYAVNEDGDKPEKREFCKKHHLEYKVLKRLPKPGLPRRESTKLRGF